MEWSRRWSGRRVFEFGGAGEFARAFFFVRS
jgi:hypothetical protein